MNALGRRKTWFCLVMSTIPKRKHKHFDIEAYYRNESKSFSFGPLIIGTKAKHFHLVPKIFFITSRSFPFCPKTSRTKQSNLVWSGNCLRQSRMFLFDPKTNRWKPSILIWFAYYRNESKTL
jgi:hypothetical protein